MSFEITGLGTALPYESISQRDAARLAVELAGAGSPNAPAIQALYRKAGIKKRYSTVIDSSTNGQPATQSFYPLAAGDVDRGPTTSHRMARYEASALELAARAAGNAIRENGTSSDEITDLVTVSCTGFSAPGVDIGLIERLGLNTGVSRTHLGFMGCHGALNGLRVAAALGQKSVGSRVLLCCVELCSIHHQYSRNPQHIVANALFSDGAAAVVGGYSSNSSTPRWRLADQRSEVVPGSTDLMGWRIGDHGFEMQLSPHVPMAIRNLLRPWLAEWLQKNSLRIDDIRSWAIHPGGPRVLTACQDALGLADADLAASRQVLEDYGNMSSPTILFILQTLRQRQDSLPCVVLAFGPGLTMEAALLA